MGKVDDDDGDDGDVMIKREKNERLRRPRGAVLTEFAVILPIFILIILGCLDLGRYAYLYVAVTNAADAGAFAGATRPFTPVSQPAWEQAITDAVTAEMQGNTGYDANQLVVATPVVTTDSYGTLTLDRVRVQVTHPFNMLVNWPGLPNQLNLSRTVEMRMIR